MESKPPLSATQNRISWPDYVKGMAIVLVVLGHLLFGLGLVDGDAAPQNDDLTLSRFTVDWIYAFHMQAFFFISGLLSLQSSRRTARDFLAVKLRSIVYPYFLWSIIQILLMLVMAGRTTHEVSWLDLLTITYHPIMQFWFLYALFAMLLVFAVLRALKFSPLAILAFSIALYLISPFLPDGTWGPIVWLCKDMIFFGVGVAISQAAITRTDNVSSKWLAVSAVACAILLTFGVWCLTPLELPDGVTEKRFMLLLVTEPLLALLGIGMLFTTGELLARGRWLDVLRRFGALTLQIYVAHTIAMAAVRMVLAKVFGIESIWIHLVAGMIAGIYLPLALWWLCQRVGFPYLFVLPEHIRNIPPEGGTKNGK
ncbi:MAG: acyltransferase [Pirellulales bacterium]|nr:acyltransferase [Pirellulales bacterium]